MNDKLIDRSKLLRNIGFIVLIGVLLFYILRTYNEQNAKLQPAHVPDFPKNEVPAKTVQDNDSIPGEAIETYQYVITHNGECREGYRGNTKFGNREKRLPIRNNNGYLNYKEYDIYPYVKGKNRGPHRVVISSENEGYYTGDHYKTFKKIQR